MIDIIESLLYTAQAVESMLKAGMVSEKALKIATIPIFSVLTELGIAELKENLEYVFKEKKDWDKKKIMENLNKMKEIYNPAREMIEIRRRIREKWKELKLDKHPEYLLVDKKKYDTLMAVPEEERFGSFHRYKIIKTDFYDDILELY